MIKNSEIRAGYPPQVGDIVEVTRPVTVGGWRLAGMHPTVVGVDVDGVDVTITTGARPLRVPLGAYRVVCRPGVRW